MRPRFPSTSPSAAPNWPSATRSGAPLAPERHGHGADRRPGRAAELERERHDRELVDLLGGDLLEVENLDDLGARRGEHVAVDGDEGVRLLVWRDVHADGVGADAHRPDVLAQVARAAEPEAGVVRDVAVEVRPPGHA